MVACKPCIGLPHRNLRKQGVCQWLELVRTLVARTPLSFACPSFRRVALARDAFALVPGHGKKLPSACGARVIFSRSFAV